MARKRANEAPQFFRGETEGNAGARLGTDRAVYRVPKNDRNGEPIVIAVEVVEGGGNVPRNATSFRTVPSAADLAKDFEKVVGVAEAVLESLKSIRPGAVEIEFGVELGGEMGIPLITRGEAKANFKITLKWATAGPPKA
jgi:hypothetical protein